MKRYHSLLGTGSGIGCHITPDMLDAADTTEAMRENHSGCWVTYHEARGIEDRLNAITQQLAVNTAEFDASTAAAYDRGLTKGRKEGQVKVDAMQKAVASYVDPDSLQANVEAAFDRGYKAGRELKEPTEAELDVRRLQAIFVNTSAMIQAIDSGEIPEDQVMLALYGGTAAYVQILGQRFGSILDERIAARKVAIAEFAA